MTETGAFGAWLRSCRQAAGLSQEVLAEGAGLSVRAVRNLERGRTGPHMGSIHQLADALKLRGEARGQFFATAGQQLAGDASAGATVAPEGGLGRPGAEQIVPRQLPGPARQFVGRDSELAALTALLDHADTTPDALLISAIGGTAGVGKTALAVRWAHQIAERFPDGQLYVRDRWSGLRAERSQPARMPGQLTGRPG
jgi:transcriptional regulator with XRE-family HTH domain